MKGYTSPPSALRSARNGSSLRNGNGKRHNDGALSGNPRKSRWSLRLLLAVFTAIGLGLVSPLHASPYEPPVFKALVAKARAAVKKHPDDLKQRVLLAGRLGMLARSQDYHSNGGDPFPTWLEAADRYRALGSNADKASEEIREDLLDEEEVLSGLLDAFPWPKEHRRAATYARRQISICRESLHHAEALKILGASLDLDGRGVASEAALREAVDIFEDKRDEGINTGEPFARYVEACDLLVGRLAKNKKRTEALRVAREVLELAVKEPYHWDFSPMQSTVAGLFARGALLLSQQLELSPDDVTLRAAWLERARQSLAAERKSIATDRKEAHNDKKYERSALARVRRAETFLHDAETRLRAAEKSASNTRAPSAAR